MKRGFVLEGGGMRCMFTCGVIDVLMEHGVAFDGLVGVSAGAAFGCNYKSGQIGRALRYNKRFAADSRYMGIGSLFRTGNILHPEFAYHTVPTQYDIFDCEAFSCHPMEFHLVCTDVLTGTPVYHQLTHIDREALEWIRATSSMPGVSTPVELEGRFLLDGGISDSIPLRYFQDIGYERCVVVLTQPEGYRKHSSRGLDMLLRVFARRYPAIRHAMHVRADMYNEQLRYVSQEASAGRALVICPDEPLGISRLEKDPARLQQVYDLGRRKAEEMLPLVREFLEVRET